jgi:hypothetical protein
MNLIGLILIAALSGGIVAVSLRLRASASSARMWSDGNRSPERETPQLTHGRRENWLQDPFGRKSETGLYHRVEDQIGG